MVQQIAGTALIVIGRATFFGLIESGSDPMTPAANALLPPCETCQRALQVAQWFSLSVPLGIYHLGALSLIVDLCLGWRGVGRRRPLVFKREARWSHRKKYRLPEHREPPLGLAGPLPLLITEGRVSRGGRYNTNANPDIQCESPLYRSTLLSPLLCILADLILEDQETIFYGDYLNRATLGMYGVFLFVTAYAFANPWTDSAFFTED
jgi:hypothetical protein